MSGNLRMSRTTRRRTGLAAVTALVAAMLQLVVAVSPAHAVAPDKVGSTLEGCRNDGTVALPDGTGRFVCPDAAYTSGNLGKGWNELDLVPYRLTLSAGNAAPTTQTYTVAYAVDAADAGRVGYDFLSVATLNTALSAASCSATSGSETVMAPGIGGIDQTRFRTLTVTQARNTTCVYDYYARLALGSHLFPGSALHANLALPTGPTTVTTSGIGASDVSIPVNEIKPQEISKTMAASQNSDHIWSVTKEPTPASLNFGNSCATAASGAQLDVNITVNWTKGPALATGYTVTTSVYAKNPASRVIAVTASDVIKSGSTTLDTVSFPAVDVPANTASFLLGTHTKSFTTAQVGSPPDFNDVASATYVDHVTGIPVPGTTTTTAAVANTAITTGTATNTTAVVSDTESITGDGLTFSVAAPSVGTFGGGYTAGTHTTGPVTWSYPASDSGSVTFAKTVYLDQPRIVTGALSDTATVTGSDSGTQSASASVSVSSGAQVALTIDKTLSPASSDPATFTFDVAGPSSFAASPTLAFAAGDTNKSTTLTGLAPGTYTVTEQATGPFPSKQGSAAITLPTCSGTVALTNTFTPPKAQVRKVTVPAGSEAGWVFTLTGTGLPAAGVDVTTTDADAIDFPAALQTGSYTITEAARTGWDLTGVSGAPAAVTTSVPGRTCSFSVGQLSDAGTVYSCVFTNTARGRILIDKVTDPVGDTTAFPFTLQGGPSALDQSFALADADGPHDSGAIRPGSGYNAAESVPAGWDQTSATCDDGSPVTNIAVSPGETVTCTFTNTQRASIVVHKITDPASTVDFGFTLQGGPSAVDQSFSLQNGQSHTSANLRPGSGYDVAESVPDGWDLSSAVCSDDSPATNVNLSPGETVHCYFTNTQRGLIVIDKVTDPSGDPQQFGFSLTGGVSAVNQAFSLADATTPHSSGFVKPGSGYLAAETPLAGWDLTSATCTDGSPVTNIAVSPGETVVCTFTNTKRAHLVIDKVTRPSGDPTVFGFTATGGPSGATINQSFGLADQTAPHDTGAVRPGTYAAQETTLPANWDLTSFTCDDGSNPSAVELSPGETVTCTATNTKRGLIRIDKVTVPSGSSQLFAFTLQGGPSGLDSAFSLADATTPYQAVVRPGVGYSAAETPAAGWDLTSFTCDDGSNPLSIDVSPGETVTCTATNTQRGRIRVDKVTDPAGSPQEFGFHLTGGPAPVSAAFALADATAPFDSGFVRPGTYAASEDTPLPTGWSLVGSACSDGSAVSAIAVAPGETVTCTFTNRARGRVALVKTVNGAPIPADSSVAFTFQLREGASPVAAGTTVETKVANAANAGTVSFSTQLVPAQTYQLCETVMPGWSTTLGTFVPNSFIPPDGLAPDPTVDNSILCVNFSVSPGQTATFNVDNTPPPGGRALTIGFWKNWASCAKSNGGKKPVLDQTLATLEPNGLVVSAQTGSYPAFAPTIYLALHGSITTTNAAPDCLKAVRLLDKSTIDKATKKASDPTFNLAAQLVAAELNYAAGAGRKPAVTVAINQAVLILGKYQFNGITYTPAKITAADAATMNNLATTLDNYNNDRP